MRKIQTAEIRAQKARKKKILVGVVLIFLMVVSTLGYSLMQGDGDEDDSSKVEENGRIFYRQNGIWVTSIEEETYGFQYLPSEVLNVSVEGDYDLERYTNQLLYYISPSEGVIEILNNLQRYVLRYQGACLNETDCEEDLPVKDCRSNLIVTAPLGMPQSIGGKIDNETRVYNNEGCVYLVGDSIKAADAFLYKVLKVN